MNTHEPDKVMEVQHAVTLKTTNYPAGIGKWFATMEDGINGFLPLQRTEFPVKTIFGDLGSCTGCGTVQTCALRINGMVDLCKSKQPAPSGAIKIGGTVITIRKDLHPYNLAPHSFRWEVDPDTNYFEKRIKAYLADKLGSAWINRSQTTVSITDDMIVLAYGEKKIILEQVEDTVATLSMEGQRDIILHAKITPNGNYWYITKDMIKRTCLIAISDSEYIPEIALSNDRDEDITTTENYSLYALTDNELDIFEKAEQEDKPHMRPTEYGFEVVTGKQKKNRMGKRQVQRQEAFLEKHGLRLQAKLRSLVTINPTKAQTLASSLTFTDWQALSSVGGLRKP